MHLCATQQQEMEHLEEQSVFRGFGDKDLFVLQNRDEKLVKCGYQTYQGVLTTDTENAILRIPNVTHTFLSSGWPRALLSKSLIKIWPNCHLSSLKVSSISLKNRMQLKVAAFFFCMMQKIFFSHLGHVTSSTCSPHITKYVGNYIPSHLIFIWSWNFNELVAKTRCFCIILWHFDLGQDFPHLVTSTEEEPMYKSYWFCLPSQVIKPQNSDFFYYNSLLQHTSYFIEQLVS